MLRLRIRHSLFASALLSGVLIALFSVFAASGQQDHATPQATRHVARVQTDIGSFGIAANEKPDPNQTSGGSRGVVVPSFHVLLCAPAHARAATLLPSFRWLVNFGAANTTPALTYDPQLEHAVFSLSDASQRVLYTAKVDGRSFTYPSTAPPLQPGKSYIWSVEVQSARAMATSSNKLMPESPATIEIVSAADRLRIGNQLAALKLSANPADAAKRANVFVQEGLWYDAVETYTAAIDSSPFTSTGDLLTGRARVYSQLAATRTLANSDWDAADAILAYKPASGAPAR